MFAVDPAGHAPTCTVVVCTRNRPAELDGCLKALGELTYPKFEVLVVDNAPSGPESREIAAQRGVGYIVEPHAGLSRARNRGAYACKSEFVAFLDDDALPEPNWLSALLLEFRDPRVMVVTGHVLPLSVETEAERLCASIDGSGSQRMRIVDRGTPSWFELANFGGLGDGCMAFRRSAFDVWPGFDERLGRGAIIDGSEEHHAFFSLIDQGYRVVFTPEARVRHPLPKTMRELRKRHLRDLSASTAYFSLLFAEQPRYRRSVLVYVRGATAGARRAWRGPSARPVRRIVPPWRAWWAYMCGPLLYARVRLNFYSHLTYASPGPAAHSTTSPRARIPAAGAPGSSPS